MEKKILSLFILFSIQSLISGDSVFIDNIDSVGITIKFGDTIVSESSDKRITVNKHPTEFEHFIKVESEIVTRYLKSSSNPDVKNNRFGCNYALIISRDKGWELHSVNEEDGCSKSIGEYNKYTYLMVNKASLAVYPAFSTTKPGDFASDSILGFLKPNESRIYSVDDDYWSKIAIVNNEIQAGFFDPYGQNYIACEDKLEKIDKNKIYTFKPNLEEGYVKCDKTISNDIVRV